MIQKSQICFNSLQYRATDYVVRGPGKFSISFEPANGEKKSTVVYDFAGEGGVIMGMYNTDEVGILTWGHPWFVKMWIVSLSTPCVLV